MTTLELLTALKAANGGASDYRIAQILGVSKQNVSAWKNGKATMSDPVAIHAAELLGLDPVTVLLDLHIEREREDATSRVWEAMRDRLQTAAMPAVVGLVGYGGGVLFGVPLI